MRCGESRPSCPRHVDDRYRSPLVAIVVLLTVFAVCQHVVDVPSVPERACHTNWLISLQQHDVPDARHGLMRPPSTDAVNRMVAEAVERTVTDAVSAMSR